MVFIGRIAFMLLRGILWTIVGMIYILVAEKVLVKAIKMIRRTNLDIVKTTILKPVAALRS